jgi:hypothetical protein
MQFIIYFLHQEILPFTYVCTQGLLQYMGKELVCQRLADKHMSPALPPSLPKVDFEASLFLSHMGSTTMFVNQSVSIDGGNAWGAAEVSCYGHTEEARGGRGYRHPTTGPLPQNHFHHWTCLICT